MKNKKSKKTNKKQELKQNKKPVTKEEIPVIGFDTWFAKKLAKNHVKFWQAYALEVYMEKHGLTGKHPEKEFEKLFLKY